jgi:hypothetical protein
MTLSMHGRALTIGALICVAGAVAGCSADRLSAPLPDSSRTAQSGRLTDTFDAGSAVFGFMDGLPATRVDRMGMPAIATAVISSKDAYNAADPTDDANGDFVPEIVASVTAIHAALDDDLAGAGLTPCVVGDCVAQAAPFVVPDVIRIDPSQASGFPNGRRLTDPVIDVTLALVLLDLSVHPVTALVGLNPTQNDHPFMGAFPYVARRNPSGLQTLLP